MKADDVRALILAMIATRARLCQLVQNLLTQLSIPLSGVRDVPTQAEGVVNSIEVRMVQHTLKSLEGRGPHVNPGSDASTVSQEAADQLQRSYAILRRVSCEYRDGLLILNGRLPSYYLKQMAQEMAARVKGVQRVDNRIEVSAAFAS
jgi:osmotically-inducible protein OsmY